jgi:tRNA wybutosine-synthesizing protein 3
MGKDRELIWKDKKDYFIQRLINDQKIGRVDEDILELLNLINSFENYYSLSSCSGRIQIIEGENLSKRDELKSIAKWHREVKLEEVKEILEKKLSSENLWISVQPPILHIACKTLEDAFNLIKIARECGFKHSGILSFEIDRYVVELNSSVRLDIPLIHEGKIVFNFDKIDDLIFILNKNLKRAKESLNLLKEKLSKMNL